VKLPVILISRYCLPLLSVLKPVRTEIIRDFAELFEGGFEVFDDFLGGNVRVGQVVGFFEGFVSKPEDIEAGFVTLKTSLSPYLPSI